MAKRKFKAKPFKNWLDILAKVCVKTDANFTCEIRREGCAGRMMPLDKNCQWCHIKSRSSNTYRWLRTNALCGCGHCHQWAHANPDAFGAWFAEEHLGDYLFLNFPMHPYTWREDDFKKEERRLLLYAAELNVDPLNVPVSYRTRFMRAMEALKKDPE